MILLLSMLACEDKPEPAEPADEPSQEPSGEPQWDADSTICGTIELENDCGDYPDTVTAWTIVEDATACQENDGWDTGWEDWRDAEVTTMEVDENGRFEGVIEAGTFGFTASSNGGCEGCDSSEVSGEHCTEITLNLDFMVTADAPNIYLYPEERTATHVQVAHPEMITVSDPVYPRGGWWSIAEPDGQLMTRDGWKDFLFYEILAKGDQFQRSEGWCVHGEQGQISIEKSMEDYGFLPNEIWDFSDFWDSEFPAAEWMTVYPQIDNLTPLRISPRPDSFLRVWYLVEDGCKRVSEPEIPAFKRVGFHASEWGVIISGNLEGPSVVTGLQP